MMTIIATAVVVLGCPGVGRRRSSDLFSINHLLPGSAADPLPGTRSQTFAMLDGFHVGTRPNHWSTGGMSPVEGSHPGVAAAPSGDRCSNYATS